MRIRIKRVGPVDIALPEYKTSGAAGADLRAAIDAPITLDPGRRRLIPAGFAIEVPVGFEAQVRPRSGLALKHGITIANSPGTIDADYRGPVGVVLINHGEEAFTIEPHERIAQMVIAKVELAEFELSETLSDTDRGAGGYGSTGR